VAVLEQVKQQLFVFFCAFTLAQERDARRVDNGEIVAHQVL